MLYESRLPSQRTLLNLSNSFSNKGYVAEIKKSFKQTKLEVKTSPKDNLIKRTIKDFFWEQETISQPSLLQSSKKIQKARNGTSTKKDVLEAIHTDTYSELLGSSIAKTKAFLEDKMKKTKNYVNLTYMNKTTAEKQEFFCFHDRDLNIPTGFSEKSISYSCDNDCATDDEQLEGAIKTLFASLQHVTKFQQ